MDLNIDFKNLNVQDLKAKILQFSGRFLIKSLPTNPPAPVINIIIIFLIFKLT